MPLPWLMLLLAPTAGADPLVRDGGFEAGAVPTFWTQASTNFGTPICSTAECGTFFGGPRIGTHWAWFGGASMPETALLEQTGEIPPRLPTFLTFYLWWQSSVDSPPDPAATLRVTIDGNTVLTATPQTMSGYHAGYRPVNLDLSAYANGASHTLRFSFSSVAGSTPTNVHIDDLAMIGGALVESVFANGFE